MRKIHRLQTLVLSLVMGLPALSFSANIEGEKNNDGSFKKWHRIEVVFEGPLANESSATFRNFRLDVTFKSPTATALTICDPSVLRCVDPLIHAG